MLFMSLFLIFSPSFHFCGCKGTYFYYKYCIFLLYLFYFATFKLKLENILRLGIKMNKFFFLLSACSIFAAQKVEICQERDANNR
jgi:hypothetical protein